MDLLSGNLTKEISFSSPFCSTPCYLLLFQLPTLEVFLSGVIISLRLNSMMKKIKCKCSKSFGTMNIQHPLLQPIRVSQCLFKSQLPSGTAMFLSDGPGFRIFGISLDTDSNGLGKSLLLLQSIWTRSHGLFLITSIRVYNGKFLTMMNSSNLMHLASSQLSSHGHSLFFTSTSTTFSSGECEMEDYQRKNIASFKIQQLLSLIRYQINYKINKN